MVYLLVLGGGWFLAAAVVVLVVGQAVQDAPLHRLLPELFVEGTDLALVPAQRLVQHHGPAGWFTCRGGVAQTPAPAAGCHRRRLLLEPGSFASSQFLADPPRVGPGLGFRRQLRITRSNTQTDQTSAYARRTQQIQE